VDRPERSRPDLADAGRRSGRPHRLSPMPWPQDLTAITGEALEPLEGKAVLVVNVASQCGLTPQYEGLERLQRRFGDQGF
jgi:hypothetical protein